MPRQDRLPRRAPTPNGQSFPSSEINRVTKSPTTQQQYFLFVKCDAGRRVLVCGHQIITGAVFQAHDNLFETSKRGKHSTLSR